MFHRILVEEWQRALSTLSILLFFIVFVLHYLSVRRMPREKISRLETLPLEDDDHV